MNDIYILLSMTLESFFETFLAVIIGGGVVQILTQQYFKKRDKDNAVEYLALRLAFLFEGYGVQRAADVSDYDVAIEEGRNPEKYFSQGVPTIPPLPFEDVHKFLDPALLNDILDFPQQCTMANSAANYSSDLGDDDGYYSSIKDDSVRMGIQALSIAKRLREKYQLTPRALTFGAFDTEKFSNHHVAEIEERDKKRQEAIAKWKERTK